MSLIKNKKLEKSLTRVEELRLKMTIKKDRARLENSMQLLLYSIFLFKSNIRAPPLIKDRGN